MNRSANDLDDAEDAAWPSDWLRATLGILALRALSRGPSYGYAIISELESRGFGAVKGGTLYPLLSRFEAAGLLSTEWRAGDGGPGRKYFALTDLGRSELTRSSSEWRRFADISTHYLAIHESTEDSE